MAGPVSWPDGVPVSVAGWRAWWRGRMAGLVAWPDDGPGGAVSVGAMKKADYVRVNRQSRPFIQVSMAMHIRTLPVQWQLQRRLVSWVELQHVVVMQAMLRLTGMMLLALGDLRALFENHAGAGAFCFGNDAVLGALGLLGCAGIAALGLSLTLLSSDLGLSDALLSRLLIGVWVLTLLELEQYRGTHDLQRLAIAVDEIALVAVRHLGDLVAVNNDAWRIVATSMGILELDTATA